MAGSIPQEELRKFHWVTQVLYRGKVVNESMFSRNLSGAMLYYRSMSNQYCTDGYRLRIVGLVK